MFWSSTYGTYIPCKGDDEGLKKKLREKEQALEDAKEGAVLIEDDKKVRQTKS